MVPLEKLVIGNGAGSVKTMGDVIKACKSAATRITVGSITSEFRAGNIGETYYYHPVDLWSMNSLGLPNIGMESYAHALPYMAQKAHEHGKQLWVSVAGFTPEQYASMTARCFLAGVDGVELNLSCPNVWGKSGRKAIPAFDREMLSRIYGEVGTALLTGPPGRRIAAKASPTDDPKLLEMFCHITAADGLVSEVVGFNTEGGQRRLRHDGKEALSFRSDDNDPEYKHEGGLAGAALTIPTPQRLKLLRQMLPTAIDIYGLGGIFNGAHAFACLEAGASGVMCTTPYIEYGAGIFSTLLEGLADIMPDAA